MSSAFASFSCRGKERTFEIRDIGKHQAHKVSRAYRVGFGKPSNIAAQAFDERGADTNRLKRIQKASRRGKRRA
jgi:hypothetical protein